MKRGILKTLLFSMIMCLSFSAQAQEGEERVYVDDLTVVPGDSEVQYLTIALENGSCDNYTGFQFDVELPAGLEVSYYDGEAEVYKAETDHVYPTKRDDHVVMYNVTGNLIQIRCFSATSKVFSKTSGNLVEIGVIPTAYLKPGEIDIKLHDVKFATSDEKYGYRADLLELPGITAEATSSLNLKVSSGNKYSTAILPFDVETIPTGLEVYSCNSTDGETLVLKKQSRIAAYTPYILYAPNGFESTLSGTVDASKYNERITDGYLTGTVVTTEIGGGNGYYVMQNKGEGAMFYKVGDTTFSIPAGRCWLTIPASMQGSTIFRFDKTTGIDEVNVENEAEESIYDLRGLRIDNTENLERGVYIINGKAVLVK